MILKVKRWAVVIWDKKTKLSTSTYNTDDTQYVCALKTSDKHWWKWCCTLTTFLPHSSGYIWHHPMGSGLDYRVMIELLSHFNSTQMPSLEPCSLQTIKVLVLESSMWTSVRSISWFLLLHALQKNKKTAACEIINLKPLSLNVPDIWWLSLPVRTQRSHTSMGSTSLSWYHITSVISK